MPYLEDLTTKQVIELGRLMSGNDLPPGGQPAKLEWPKNAHRPHFTEIEVSGLRGFKHSLREDNPVAFEFIRKIEWILMQGGYSNEQGRSAKRIGSLIVSKLSGDTWTVEQVGSLTAGVTSCLSIARR